MAVRQAFMVSAVIDRPIDEVWQALTAVQRWPSWMNGIEAARLADGDDLEAGSRVLFRARGTERASVAARCEPSRWLSLESRQGGFQAVYDYRCFAEGARTRVELDARCSANGMLARLMSPLIRRLIAKTDRGRIDSLKRALEGGTA